MIRTHLDLFTATHIHPNTVNLTCRRCGIRINWDRAHRYDQTCRDCAPWLGIKRAA